ncbi:MAG: hypothetical protein JNL23_13205 [Chitinophagaceae bacterium]|nr:hypothetical protein [Chitinophagaceae bacterium]
MDISELKRIDETNIRSRHPWELARSRIIYTLIKKRAAPVGTIIDFGSGDMFLLHNLEQKKIATNYFAIDNAYTKPLIENLKHNYPESVIVPITGINDIDSQSLPADVFLFLDVIEHCENDRLILSNAANKRFADTDSTILITAPAFQSLFSYHDKLLNHYRRYNLKELSEACRSSGLHVTQKGYFFFSLLPLRIFQLFLEKIKISKPEKSIDNWKGGKTLTSLLSSLLWLDFKISYLIGKTGIKLPGLSCYCICHPSQS